VARGDEWRVTAALLHGPLHRGIHPRPRWRPRWPTTRRSGLLAVTSGRTLQVGLGLEYFEYLSAQSQCRSVIFSLKSRNLIGLAVTYSALSCLTCNGVQSSRQGQHLVLAQSCILRADYSHSWICTIHHDFPSRTPHRARCSQPRWLCIVVPNHGPFFSCSIHRLMQAYCIRQPTASCLGASITKLHLENGTSCSGRCSYTLPARSSIVFSPSVFRAHSLARSP
jgi:hypothetical protein